MSGDRLEAEQVSIASGQWTVPSEQYESGARGFELCKGR